MNDKKRQPVYVHCAQGADRTGLVVALYRVVYQHMDVLEAYAEMWKNGHDLIHMFFTYPMDVEFFTLALKAVRAEEKSKCSTPNSLLICGRAY